jgi:hypothetical protein
MFQPCSLMKEKNALAYHNMVINTTVYKFYSTVPRYNITIEVTNRELE